MPLTLDQLEEKLLALPAESRERLAISLYESVDIPGRAQHEFSPDQLHEFDRRYEELASGATPGIPLDAVMRQLDQLLAHG
jgi:putative addiction module component (TIGR02574 family)